MDFNKEDLKPQLKQANKLRANYSIIYGEEEAVKNIVVIKNMTSGDQNEVALDKIKEYFSHV